MSEQRSPAETIYPGLAQTSDAGAVPEPAPETTTAAPEEAAPQEPGSTLVTRSEEPKPEGAAEPPPDPFDSEKIEFPVEMKADPELFGKFSELAKASNLSHKAAQDLVNFYHTAASAQAQKAWDDYNALQETWVAEVKADPQIGPILPTVVKTIGELFSDRSIGGPALREVAEETRAGNKLGFIRSLYLLQKERQEGTHVAGNGPAPQETRRSHAQSIFPNLPSERN